jgi:hypothetical protein
MINEEQSLQVSKFWIWFQEHEANFEELIQTDNPFWDIALAQLHKIERGLWFMISNHASEKREFVFTAEGKSELFPLVEFIVSRAPALSSWEFIALKPPKGFDFKTVYEGIELDPKTMWFLHLTSKSNPKAFGLRVGIPVYDSQHERSLTNGVVIILETALGERAVAEEFLYVEVGRLPDNPGSEGYIELLKLAQYIEFHKRKVRCL